MEKGRPVSKAQLEGRLRSREHVARLVVNAKARSATRGKASRVTGFLEPERRILLGLFERFATGRPNWRRAFQQFVEERPVLAASFSVGKRLVERDKRLRTFMAFEPFAVLLAHAHESAFPSAKSRAELAQRYNLRGEIASAFLQGEGEPPQSAAAALPAVSASKLSPTLLTANPLPSSWRASPPPLRDSPRRSVRVNVDPMPILRKHSTNASDTCAPSSRSLSRGEHSRSSPASRRARRICFSNTHEEIDSHGTQSVLVESGKRTRTPFKRPPTPFKVSRSRSPAAGELLDSPATLNPGSAGSAKHSREARSP